MYNMFCCCCCCFIHVPNGDVRGILSNLNVENRGKITSKYTENELNSVKKKEETRSVM